MSSAQFWPPSRLTNSGASDPPPGGGVKVVPTIVRRFAGSTVSCGSLS